MSFEESYRAPPVNNVIEVASNSGSDSVFESPAEPVPGPNPLNAKHHKFFVDKYLDVVEDIPEYPPRLLFFDPKMIPKNHAIPAQKIKVRPNRPMISRGKQNWTVQYEKGIKKKYRSTSRIIDLSKLVETGTYDTYRKHFTSLTIDAYISHYFDNSRFLKAYRTNIANEHSSATLFPRHESLEVFIKKMYENQRPFTENLVYFLIAEILAALAELHDCNIVHNDITPGSVFFDEFGNIVLGDFIFSSLLSDEEAQEQKERFEYSAFNMDVIGVANILVNMVAPKAAKKVSLESKPLFDFEHDFENALQYSYDMKACIGQVYAVLHVWGVMAELLHSTSEGGRSLAQQFLDTRYSFREQKEEGRAEFHRLLRELDLEPKEFQRKKKLSVRLLGEIYHEPLVKAEAEYNRNDPFGDERVQLLREASDAVIDVKIYYDPDADPHAVEPDFWFTARPLNEHAILKSLLRFIESSNGAPSNTEDYTYYPWEALSLRKALFSYIREFPASNFHRSEDEREIVLTRSRLKRVLVKFSESVRKGRHVHGYEERSGFTEEQESPE